MNHEEHRLPWLPSKQSMHISYISQFLLVPFLAAQRQDPWELAICLTIAWRFCRAGHGQNFMPALWDLRAISFLETQFWLVVVFKTTKMCARLALNLSNQHWGLWNFTLKIYGNRFGHVLRRFTNKRVSGRRIWEVCKNWGKIPKLCTKVVTCTCLHQHPFEQPMGKCV